MDSISAMKKLALITPVSDSEIYIMRGALSHASALCASRFRGRRAHFVTDTNVEPLYFDRVKASFQNEGFTISQTTLAAGEASKTLESVSLIYDDLVAASITRADLVVALGGGVIGDIAGFAASTYLRGVNLCQIPTTLLAQVDSSVGGKCGVDLKSGKNLVGAFYQPHIVVIDPDLLKTLPETHFCDGMAEVIKYGFIADEGILVELSRSLSDDSLTEIITRCVTIKRDIVVKDERDQSVRMLLNFGHTVGHALEALGGYHALTHGQAVAIGMKAALKAGLLLGVTEKGSLDVLLPLLRRFGLDKSVPYDAEAIAGVMFRDKKVFSSTLSFILVKKPGEAVIHNLSLTSVRQLLDEICKGGF